jgi:hypothetical protein
MSVDVTLAVEQDEIANGLLGEGPHAAPIVATLTHEGNFIQAPEGFSEAEHGESVFDKTEDYFSEALYEQEHDAQKLGDAGLAAKIEREGGERPQQREAALEREQSREQEQPQEQPQAATPEQVAQVSESLEQAVEQFGLNDTATANEFAADFVGAFGSTPHDANVDVQALGGVMAKAALSTVAIYEATGGDMSKLPAIPEDAARKFAFDLLSSYRMDPRTMPNVDPVHLARTVQGGMFNFLNTYYQRFGGRVSDLRQLNEPQAAEFYMQNFMRALGVEGQPDRQTAIRFADACGKYILGVVGKLQRAQEQNTASQGKGSRSRTSQRVPERFREGVKGSKAPKKTGDEFWDSAMQSYHHMHGRL